MRRTAGKLAESGVAIMTNAPGSRPFPPVAVLRKAGVTVFSGNDNIRDSWWPYGDGDMLGRAMTSATVPGSTPTMSSRSRSTWPPNGAKALRLPGYGIAVGANADFVALIAEHIQEAVASVASSRSVYKGGALLRGMGCWLRASPPVWSRACAFT